MTSYSSKEEVRERVCSVLSDNSLRQLIRRRLIDARKYESSQFGELSRNDCLYVDESTIQKLSEDVEKHLSENLGFPKPITSSEFQIALFQQMGGRPLEEEFDQHYERAVEFAIQCIFREMIRSDEGENSTLNWLPFGLWHEGGPISQSVGIDKAKVAGSAKL